MRPDRARPWPVGRTPTLSLGPAFRPAMFLTEFLTDILFVRLTQSVVLPFASFLLRGTGQSCRVFPGRAPRLDVTRGTTAGGDVPPLITGGGVHETSGAVVNATGGHQGTLLMDSRRPEVAWP